MTLNPFFQNVSATPATFTVSYSGGSDGAVVVVQYGDGTIDQATATGYTARFSHTYGADRAYDVSAEVYTSGCLAPCTASATVLSSLEYCFFWPMLAGYCVSEPALLPSVSVPNGVPDAAPAMVGADSHGLVPSSPSMRYARSRPSVFTF